MMDTNPIRKHKELKVTPEQDHNLLGQTLIDHLPIAVYTCDKFGYITFYNRAAALLWGREPEVGRDLWCGSWKIYKPNGDPLALESRPMARALKEGIALEGELIIIERPDGTKVNVKPYPVPTFDSEGQLTGAINTLINYNDFRHAEENQALLASIVNSSNDAIISKTLNGMITSWNQAAERMFGYSVDEIVGKHISILIPPSRLQEENNIISNIAKGNKVEHFETVRLSKDGLEIPVSLTVSPLFDNNGRVIGASKIARDVTERNDAEEKQALLAAVVQGSDNAVISKSLDGIIGSWNPAAEKMFGYTQDEILGKHISILIPPDRLAEENLIVTNIAKGNMVEQFETVRLTKGGLAIPISLSVSPVMDRSGKIIGASKIARDITQLKIAEKNQAVLAAIVETSDDAIISKTLTGIITSWNQAAEKMFGYKPAEVIGKHISLLIPADRIQEEVLIINKIAEGNKVDHFETVRLAKDGTEIPISLTISPVTDRSGNIIGASKIARDISEQLKVQTTKAQLFKEIKALNDKKDEFIGIASHELKTPLTSISGYLQILDRFETDDNSKKFLLKTIQQVNKLTGLVSDMLDVSKIEAGKLQYSKERFDIRLMMNSVLELIEHTHSNHEIVMETSFESLYMHGDEQRIGQVMINLITNAIKYSPNPAKISVSLSCTDREITVGVKDSGFGIAADNLTHIFSRFYRVEDSNPTISGLGIGLYITSQIIERHQGKIWAESELGKGSTFWFSIPRWG